MVRLRPALALVLAAGAVFTAASSCDDSRDVDPRLHVGAPPPTVAASASALTVVEELHSIFRDENSRPLLPPSAVEHFTSDGSWLRPRFGAGLTRGVSRDARVMLPATYDRPFQVHDATSGVGIAVRLERAEAVPGEVSDGYVVYRGGAGRDTHVVHRAHTQGTEDYVLFRGPSPSRLRYQVDLGKGVAALRLVANALEFLDEDGAPRLRIDRPVVVDGEGNVAPATVSVEGCEVSRSPRAPWHRDHPAPGQRDCVIELSWPEDVGRVPPLVVDPNWTTTGSMLTPRTWHDSILLADGRVLAVGGAHVSASADLYDEATGTWAATGSLSKARKWGAATLLPSGKVLLSGGYGATQGDDLTSVETYDVATGLWSPAAPLAEARLLHTATLLANGTVLVAGGDTATTCCLASAEVYDEQLNTWTTVGAMSADRRSHTATLLTNGQVLLVGGQTSGLNLQSAELYDPISKTFSPTPNLADIRVTHTATRLQDGRVLVAGGSNIGSAEIYDPVVGAWSGTASMSTWREASVAALLGGGSVLVAGGKDGNDPLASAEIFDPVTETWTATGSMNLERRHPAATRLLSGFVLVSGGSSTTGSLAVSSSELFGLIPGSGTCVADGECLSGYCVDGFCCNTACDGLCEGCAQTKTGAANGTCAPISEGTDPDSDCTDDGSPGCQNNGFCDGSGSCESYPVSNGCSPEPCTSGVDCTSGFCADGICCDSDCDQNPCDACTGAKKGGGVDGVCAAVAADTDPNGDCAPDPGFPSSCLGDGECDGNGQCRAFALSGVSCGATTCEGGQLVGAECDGAGSCDATAVSCAPYICADAFTCTSSCSDSSGCATSAYCESSVCIAKKPNGEGCLSSEQCSSGFCVDSICCETACNASSCDQGQLTVSSCGSTGACKTASTPCAPYSCLDASSCSTTCESDEECAPNHYCAGGECLAESDLGESCESDEECVSKLCTDARCCSEPSCEPYRCSSDGTCREVCTSTAHCLAGFECNSAGQCVELPPVVVEGPGCSFRTSAPQEGRAPWILGLALGLAFSCRRRRS